MYPLYLQHERAGFVALRIRPQGRTHQWIKFTAEKTRFFNLHSHKLNERQLKVVTRMWDAGPSGFEGGMNARKYISIAKSSQATAIRNLQDLVKKGILATFGSGRSTKYIFINNE